MSDTYFVADLHYGHELVAKHRGFDSALEHDKAVAFSLLRETPDHSTLWVLGDLVGRNDDTGYALDLLNILKWGKGMTLHLVAGNHDSVHPMYRRAHKKQAKYLEVFNSVQSSAVVRHNKQDVLLSHFPYEADRGEPRHTQWRLPDEGLRLIHGHTHQAAPTVDRRPNEVCVSWDAWRRPVSLHEAMKAIDERWMERTILKPWKEAEWKK